MEEVEVKAELPTYLGTHVHFIRSLLLLSCNRANVIMGKEEAIVKRAPTGVALLAQPNTYNPIVASLMVSIYLYGSI